MTLIFVFHSSILSASDIASNACFVGLNKPQSMEAILILTEN